MSYQVCAVEGCAYGEGDDDKEYLVSNEVVVESRSDEKKSEVCHKIRVER